MQRREFLKNSTALLGSASLLNLPGLPILDMGTAGVDEVATLKIGKMSCTLFRDLVFKYQAKDFFMNATPEEIRQTLIKYQSAPDTIPSPFIPLLVQQKNKRILVDTGVGFSEKPINVRGNTVQLNGQLQHLLGQNNVTKEEITDVIITHFHPDHIGGVFTEDGKLNYPNARFHMHEDEWHYWHTSASDNQPGQFKYFIEKNITPLREQNLHLIKGDWVELLPGITAVKAQGHTPGQIALIIKSGKEHLLYISDVFLHPLHIERVNWQTNYDLDHEKARQTRIKMLELAYQDNMLVNAFHFDFPGLGRVDKQANQWTWKYEQK